MAPKVYVFSGFYCCFFDLSWRRLLVLLIPYVGPAILRRSTTLLVEYRRSSVVGCCLPRRRGANIYVIGWSVWAKYIDI